MRVSLFGLFLRCISLMGPNLSVYNHFAWNQFYLGFSVFWWLYYDRPYMYFHSCSNPPISCTWHLCPSWLATWLCIILAWGVSLTPLDSHVQVLEPGACVQSGAAVAWTSSRPFRAPFFQTPCMSLEFSSLNSWVLFYSFHTCTFLYTCMRAPFILFYSCTSACIPAVHICISFVLSHLRILVIWYYCNIVITSGDNFAYVLICWNV